MKRATLFLLIAVIGLAAPALAGSGGSGGGTVEVTGVFGLTPVGEQSYIGMFIPLDAGQALAGLMWYNNDGTVAFPQLLLASGSSDEPVGAAEATLILEDVSGASSDWSEVLFAEPVASANDGLYALFQLPPGSECVAEGAGGGAGIGYGISGGGAVGWLSGDGETWARLSASVAMAVRPIVVAAEPGMMVMRRVERTVEEAAAAAPQFPTRLLPAAPNPFNPQTMVRFSLAEEGRVELTVYDVRGELVRRLLDSEMASGEHVVSWDGRDDGGRSLSSGVYFVRFQSGRVRTTERVLLIR
jgi:hypothetical protein